MVNIIIIIVVIIIIIIYLFIYFKLTNLQIIHYKNIQYQIAKQRGQSASTILINRGIKR